MIIMSESEFSFPLLCFHKTASFFSFVEISFWLANVESPFSAPA